MWLKIHFSKVVEWRFTCIYILYYRAYQCCYGYIYLTSDSSDYYFLIIINYYNISLVHITIYEKQIFTIRRPSWSWTYGNWIQKCTTTCVISAYHLWRCEFESHSWRGVLDTALCDKVCQWLVAGQWFSPGTPVSSTNKTDRHDITEILLKVALNTLTV